MRSRSMAARTAFHRRSSSAVEMGVFNRSLNSGMSRLDSWFDSGSILGSVAVRRGIADNSGFPSYRSTERAATWHHRIEAQEMSTQSVANVLIICPEPEAYPSRLVPAFPQVKFSCVAALECTQALDRLGEADAILAYGRAFDAECLARSKRLKWFQCLITGTDHLAPVLAGSRVILTNARGIHGPQMAEMAILHMLALSRQVPQLVRNQAAHFWDRILPRVLGRRTIAILGVGAIAEHIAKVCQVFGMTTLGISRTPRQLAGFDAIYPREKLREAAAQADFLLALVPYTHENDKIINASVF